MAWRTIGNSKSYSESLAGKAQRLIDFKPTPGFTFRDAGTVVSLGRAGAVYQADLGVRSHSLIVDGFAAIGLYKFLYRKHLFSVYGLKRALFQSLSHWLQRLNQPSIKLH